MEIKKCKCGKASMTYEIIGMDLWSGVPVNTIIRKDRWDAVCICKICNDEYDQFDPHMVKILK